jgi:hypothetical protein
MATSTINTSLTENEQTFRRKVYAFMSELRYLLELTGQAYFHGRTAR